MFVAVSLFGLVGLLLDIVVCFVSGLYGGCCFVSLCLLLFWR